MSETKNIMIVGVGGQGTLLTSRILGIALLSGGFDVRVSEVHGMSQRGGSVVTYVKYGKKVYSPVICRGEADIILSFELLESARWLPYLKKDGILITSIQKINPMPVITGASEYPENIIEKIHAKGWRIIAADAMTLAKSAGNEKTTNVVLIGIMTEYLGIDAGLVENSLKELVPKKFLDINIKAYALGRNAIG
jgi:indolepyruvate ferredoxin oxidoreductase beta subunit